MSLTRRILAIIIGVGGCSVLAYKAVMGDGEALVQLGTLTGMIVAFYFGTKAV